jgi:hypothetical protein
MSAMAIAWIVFGCVFGGALLGMVLRRALPAHHLNQDSKDVVKLGTGLIATMAALVIGLLIASAKGSFDTQSRGLQKAAADLVLIDRVLAHYGPESQDARDVIRRMTAAWLDLIWPENGARAANLETAKAAPAQIERVQDKIRDLAPRNDEQRELRARALQLAEDVAQTRWLLVGQVGSRAIPVPFLVVLVVWLVVIFVSFGLLSPPNTTVVVVLFICALSAAGAIFLILEMERPFEGLMKISGAPMREAFSHLGQQ